MLQQLDLSDDFVDDDIDDDTDDDDYLHYPLSKNEIIINKRLKFYNACINGNIDIITQLIDDDDMNFGIICTCYNSTLFCFCRRPFYYICNNNPEHINLFLNNDNFNINNEYDTMLNLVKNKSDIVIRLMNIPNFDINVVKHNKDYQTSLFRDVLKRHNSSKILLYLLNRTDFDIHKQCGHINTVYNYDIIPHQLIYKRYTTVFCKLFEHPEYDSCSFISHYDDSNKNDILIHACGKSTNITLLLIDSNKFDINYRRVSHKQCTCRNCYTYGIHDTKKHGMCVKSIVKKQLSVFDTACFTERTKVANKLLTLGCDIKFGICKETDKFVALHNLNILYNFVRSEKYLVDSYCKNIIASYF